jgi:MFS family permease
VGGALVDRLPRRWVSVASDVLRGLLLLALAALQASGSLQIIHLYVLASLFGFVRAFAQPAFRALVQALIPPDERVSGNALVSGGATAAGLIGPALGGLVMAAGGTALAFLLDGLSFLVAALALLPARPEEPHRPKNQVRVFSDLGEAIHLLKGRRFLLGAMAAMALILVTSQAPVVLLRPWVAERAGGGVSTLSMAYTAFSAGMLLTVILMGAGKAPRHRGAFIFGGMALTGLCQAGMAVVTAPWQLWALEFLIGASIMIYGVIWPAVLQDSVPPAAMGRISAIDQFGTTVLYPAGIALVGVLSTAPGPYWTELGGGLLTIAVAGLALLLPNE